MNQFLVFLLFIAAMVCIVVYRGLEMKKLANDGVVTKGRIIEKSRRMSSRGKMSTPYLKYEFDVNGQRYERRIAVGEKIFDEREEGDAIGVVYLKAKPKINAARYMVNLSREALDLPPL